MKLKFSGHVYYANGDPIPNVAVRMFDQDASGKQDDDLTVAAGLSDEQGHFELTYEPLRYLDFHTAGAQGTPDEPFNAPKSGLRLPDLGDAYLPYLQFNYTFNGLIRQHSAPLGILKSKFHLPENPPLQFIPSIHGFKFVNRFSGYFLPFSPPAFMGSSKVSSKYGLCGGMCSAAYDFLLTGRSVPSNTKIPSQGSRLQRYLFRRQMDSLGGMGQQVVKVAQWTSMPEDTLLGTQAHTASEFAHLRLKLDDANPVILALIYERADTLKELSRAVFKNHQVLAFAYHAAADGGITLNIYDPNLPGRDDVTIRCERVSLGQLESASGPVDAYGLKCDQFLGDDFYQHVRGFFRMPYEPVKPPERL